jgi:hypothetical protein
MASAESVLEGWMPSWLEHEDSAPPFPITGPPGKALFFHEWLSTAEVVPGKWLACGAWIDGEDPPRMEYDEERGDSIADGFYTLRDRAIYLVGSDDKPEYLWRDSRPIDVGHSSFELAFLPSDHSKLEKVVFSYVYRVNGGVWLRVDYERDHEGAGVNEGMFLLDLRKGAPLLLAGATEIRMY